nr:LytTR family DNA-binding domain-containing protein [uncultured Bacillus sp.]
MLKVYIVDDEPLARDELKYILHKTKQVNTIGENDNMEDAVMEIVQLKPDVVFLDIELEEGTGLELAAQLENLSPTPAIVFATAYDEYALQAFESNALDYILKPFDENRIMHTLDKINKLRTFGKGKTLDSPSIRLERNGKIALSIEEKIILVPFSDVLYVASSEGKSLLKTQMHEYKVNEPLVEIEKRLNSAQFLRVHRSYVVNFDQIDEIEPWFNSTYNLIMKDHSKVPVSRTYVKDLKRVLGI